MTLAVTFESAILCDISQGLSYTWTFWNSQGWPVALPPTVSTHRQMVTVPSYFLEPGNYTAFARVGVRLTNVPPASAGAQPPLLQPALSKKTRVVTTCVPGLSINAYLVPLREQIACPNTGKVIVKISFFF